MDIEALDVQIRLCSFSFAKIPILIEDDVKNVLTPHAQRPNTKNSPIYIHCFMPNKISSTATIELILDFSTGISSMCENMHPLLHGPSFHMFSSS